MAAADSVIVEIIKIITDSQKEHAAALKDLAETVQRHDKQSDVRGAAISQEVARFVTTVELCTKDVVTMLQKLTDEVQGNVNDDLQQMKAEHAEMQKTTAALYELVQRLLWAVGLTFTIAMLAFAYVEFH